VAKLPIKTAAAVDETASKRGPKPKPFDYNRVKAAFRKPSDFARYLAGYPDLSGVLAYVYRLKPKIDLTRIGIRDSHILKTADTEQMTLDHCAKTFGRGVFMLKLTDANRKPEQEVARVWFEIDDPELPPIYDPRTLLLNDHDNADEVARLLAAGVLVRDESGSPRIRTEGAAAPVAVPAVPAPVAVAVPAPAPSVFPVSMGDQLISKLLDRALPSATPQTASDVLEQSFRIADRLRPVSAETPSLDQIADAVVLRLRPVLAPAASAGIAGELETYERVSGLLDRLGVGKALDGAAAAAPAWVALLAPVLDSFVKPLVPLLAGLLQQKQGRPGGAPAPVTVAGSLPAAVGSVEVSAGVPGASLPAFLPADAPIMDRLSQVALLGSQKMAAGVTGFDFCAWLIGFYPGGTEVYRLMERAGGPSGVIGFMSMSPNPELRAVCSDPVSKAALEDWLSDFFSFPVDDVAEGEGKAAA
jgi:hypothetical protein